MPGERQNTADAAAKGSVRLSTTGAGNLDYSTYLSELAKRPADVPLMLEHLSSQQQYHDAPDYILAL